MGGDVVYVDACFASLQLHALLLVNQLLSRRHGFRVLALEEHVVVVVLAHIGVAEHLVVLKPQRSFDEAWICNQVDPGRGLII